MSTCWWCYKRDVWINDLGTINVYTRLHGNPISELLRYLSLKQPTDRLHPHLKPQLKIPIQTKEHNAQKAFVSSKQCWIRTTYAATDFQPVQFSPSSQQMKNTVDKAAVLLGYLEGYKELVL